MLLLLQALSLQLSTVTSLSQAGELPMTVVPFEKLEFCTNPDGSPQSLGAGSFGTVGCARSVLALGRQL